MSVAASVSHTDALRAEAKEMGQFPSLVFPPTASGLETDSSPAYYERQKELVAELEAAGDSEVRSCFFWCLDESYSAYIIWSRFLFRLHSLN